MIRLQLPTGPVNTTAGQLGLSCYGLAIQRALVAAAALSIVQTDWCLQAPIQIDQLSTIVEFGAGCGGLGGFTKSLGFNGKWIVYDFPELTRVQRYNLQVVRAAPIVA